MIWGLLRLTLFMNSWVEVYKIWILIFDKLFGKEECAKCILTIEGVINCFVEPKLRNFKSKGWENIFLKVLYLNYVAPIQNTFIFLSGSLNVIDSIDDYNIAYPYIGVSRWAIRKRLDIVHLLGVKIIFIMGRAISQDVGEKVCQMYRNGWNIKEIVREMGLSVKSVRNIMKTPRHASIIGLSGGLFGLGVQSWFQLHRIPHRTIMFQGSCTFHSWLLSRNVWVITAKPANNSRKSQHTCLDRASALDNFARVSLLNASTTRDQLNRALLREAPEDPIQT